VASTIELQRTINLTQQFIRLSPLTFAANTANDPAFSNADWVMQTMLAPPFAWRWNRTSEGTPSVPAFATTAGTTDYKISLPDFGWLEKATLYEPDNGNAAHELKVDLLIAGESLSSQPTIISTQLDDGEGNITFRLFPAPDKIYNCVLEFQNAAQLFIQTDQMWSPIPDYLSYVYNQGFAARAYEYMNDPRWSTSMQLFYQQLAQVSEGLSESQKNLWLTDRLNTLRQEQSLQKGR
jgi:hypothetical protein